MELWKLKSKFTAGNKCKNINLELLQDFNEMFKNIMFFQIPDFNENEMDELGEKYTN